MIYKGDIDDIPSADMPMVVMEHGDVRFIVESPFGKVKMQMNVAGFWGWLHRSNPNEYEWIDKMVRLACLAAKDEPEKVTK